MLGRLSREEWRELVAQREIQNPMWDSLSDVPFDYFELSHRAIYSLRNMGMDTFGYIVRLTDEEILSIPNVGKKTLRELRTMQHIFSEPKVALARLGYFVTYEKLKEFKKTFGEIIKVYEDLDRACELAIKQDSDVFIDAWNTAQQKGRKNHG